MICKVFETSPFVYLNILGHKRQNFFPSCFYSQEIGRKRLPWSSTCSMSLMIPRNVGDPDVFCGLLKQSLTEGHGFGKI